MKRIDYYFSKGPNEKNLCHLVKTPLFQQIVDFLRLQNGEPVLLRRLKEALATEENIEYTLEKMIQLDLIERNDRRYSLLFPIYESGNNAVKLNTLNLSELITFCTNLNPKDLALFLGEWLWSECFPENEPYFFGLEREVGAEDFFLTKMEAGNPELSFVSIHNEKKIPIDLATYFSTLESNEIPTELAGLHDLIGDVDINYFITQAKRVIKNAEKNRKVLTRRNIFQESLIRTGDIAVNELDELALRTSIVQTKDYMDLSIGMKIVSSILEEYSQLQLNERILVSKFLYQQIFVQLSKEEESLTYFKI